MNIQARTFTSAAEQQAAAKAVRDRLFPAKQLVRKKPVVVMDAEPAPEPEPAPPIFNVADTPPQPIDFALAATGEFVAHLAPRPLLYADIDFIGSFQKIRFPIREIMEKVLGNYPGVTVADVMSANRFKKNMAARHHCIYEIHMQRRDLSLPTLGRLIGGRDHSTIYNSIKKHKARLAAEKSGK